MANLLIKALINPSDVNYYNAKDWQLLIQQARATNLLGRLAYLFEQYSINLPSYALWHFKAIQVLNKKHRMQTQRELLEITKIIPASDHFIVLKGAAYQLLNLSCAHGRFFSDIDILVKKQDINRLEFLFKNSHWSRTEIDDYDDKYYRQWMHEIPPLQHQQRRTILDVHHNILPLTDARCPNVELFEYQQVQGRQGIEFTALCPADLVIHSAVHLFSETEFQNGLRDLSDLYLMIGDFKNTENDFLDVLISRAETLGFSVYLWLALRYLEKIFLLDVSSTHTIKVPFPKWKVVIYDFCFVNIFKPDHRSCKDWKMVLASFILYCRGHLLKMPINLLLPHLAKKSIKRIKDLFIKDKTIDANSGTTP